jgi:hypothetical protein
MVFKQIKPPSLQQFGNGRDNRGDPRNDSHVRFKYVQTGVKPIVQPT